MPNGTNNSKTNFFKENWAVLAAFALPLLVILGFAAYLYFPPLLLSSDYNFVYAFCESNSSYYHRSYYCPKASVVDNKIKIAANNKIKGRNSEEGTLHFFLHDVKANQSKEITLEEAQKLRLSGLRTSPDDVTFSFGREEMSSGGFFPFPPFFFEGRSRAHSFVLIKGNTRKKLNLIASPNQYYYYNNFQFVGWVLPVK